MSFSEIFSDALRYPISEPSKFLIIGVIALIASLTSSITNYSTNIALLVVLGIVSVIASFFLIGYGVSVINSAFNGSSDVPELDFVKNIVDGIKAFVINVIYFIIPILVFIILMLISGVAVGGNMSGIVAVGIVNLIIAFIVFVIFAILGEIAIAKFAKTGDFVSSLMINDVFSEVKQIGFLKILGFIIIQAIIIFLVIIVMSFISFIPFIGTLIASFVLGSYVIFFTNRSLGLFYANN